MCSTVGSFPLIYNNKKAILKLDGKRIDLVSWNINCASSHTWLSPAIELHEVSLCDCVNMFRYVRMHRKRCEPQTTTHSIRLSNKTGIMGIRLVSEVMAALFALTLLCGTKAIFWQCTHANSDSLAPESPMPGEMCWVKSASLNPHTHIRTHTNTSPPSAPCKCAGAQTHIQYKCIHKHKDVHT